MKSAVWKLFFLAMYVVVACAPSAGAEIITMAPHEKTFDSAIGSFTVGTRDEAINRVPPLNEVGTTREAFVSETSYARLNGSAGGVLRSGYHVGCAEQVGPLMFGTWSQGALGTFVTPGAPGPPSLNGFIDPQPLITLNLLPGQVREVPLAEKELVPGKTVTSVMRDYHIVVNQCSGPVSIREYAYVYVQSAEVDDSGAIFGDPTWL